MLELIYFCVFFKYFLRYLFQGMYFLKNSAFRVLHPHPPGTSETNFVLFVLFLTCSGDVVSGRELPRIVCTEHEVSGDGNSTALVQAVFSDLVLSHTSHAVSSRQADAFHLPALKLPENNMKFG